MVGYYILGFVCACGIILSCVDFVAYSLEVGYSYGIFSILFTVFAILYIYIILNPELINKLVLFNIEEVKYFRIYSVIVVCITVLIECIVNS